MSETRERVADVVVCGEKIIITEEDLGSAGIHTISEIARNLMT